MSSGSGKVDQVQITFLYLYIKSGRVDPNLIMVDP